jgi:hypothetical protein
MHVVDTMIALLPIRYPINVYSRYGLTRDVMNMEEPIQKMITMDGGNMAQVLLEELKMI